MRPLTTVYMLIVSYSPLRARMGDFSVTSYLECSVNWHVLHPRLQFTLAAIEVAGPSFGQHKIGAFQYASALGRDCWRPWQAGIIHIWQKYIGISIHNVWRSCFLGELWYKSHILVVNCLGIFMRLLRGIVPILTPIIRVENFPPPLFMI